MIGGDLPSERAMNILGLYVAYNGDRPRALFDL